MSLIKLFLGGNNLVFSRPERVWSVTSRLGTGKWLTLFYSVADLQDFGDPAPVLDDAELDEETGQTVLVILLTGAGQGFHNFAQQKKMKTGFPHIHKGHAR
jgi:hypothetical protein